jgi:hypothetical protein
MPELRWTLLILGVVFIVALAWWERRRPHQASRQTPHIGGEPRTGLGTDTSWGPEPDTFSHSGAHRVIREPTITLPEIRAREAAPPRDSPLPNEPMHAPSESSMAPREASVPPPPVPGELPVAAREVPVVTRQVPVMAREIPVVEIPDDDSLVGLGVQPDRVKQEVAAEKFARSAGVEKAIEDESGEHEDEYEDKGEVGEGDGEGEDIVPVAEAPQAAEQEAASPVAPPALPVKQPLVEWPPEDQRKLVALRLVAPPPERFQGRLLRQA